MALLGELLAAVQITAGGARPSERGEGYAMKQLARSCTRSLTVEKTRGVFQHAFNHGSAQSRLIRNGSASAPVDWDAALDEAELIKYTSAVTRVEAREEARDEYAERTVGRKSPTAAASGDDSDTSEQPRSKRGKRGGAKKKNADAARRLILKGETADEAKAKKAKEAAAAAHLGQPKGDWQKVSITCLASKDATMAASSAVSVFARALQESDPSLRRGSMPCFFNDYTKLGCNAKNCMNCDAMKALGAKRPVIDKAIIAHIKSKCDARTLGILK